MEYCQAESSIDAMRRLGHSNSDIRFTIDNNEKMATECTQQDSWPEMDLPTESILTENYTD